MKRWPVVEVEWRDAHGGDIGWAAIKPRHSKPAKIRTVGMLARESKSGLVVILSWDDEAKLAGDYVFIPRESVVCVRTLDGTAAR